MKPVDRKAAPRTYAMYGDAKPDLISRLGQQCSYCEAPGRPQDLHVEHIYPKDAHPERKTKWDNFLIACNTCNSYKHQYLGTKRRRGLEKKYLWPHLDNTFSAFVYLQDGRVEVNANLDSEVQKAASLIREMVGILRSPARAKRYADLGIAYDGIDNREEHWRMVTLLRDDYKRNPTSSRVQAIARTAPKLGYFSIWMEAFEDLPEVRSALIDAFKADPNCFNAKTKPVKKGRV